MQPLGKGQNVENQNVKSPKVDPKFEKDQNIKSLFKIDLDVESQKFVKRSERESCEKMTS
jgi:hypothetical protein